MNETVFEPRRFQSAVAFYEKYRLGYPKRLTDRLIALMRLKPGDPVLDLGCGPGLLALAFARAGLAVTAMDPEPDMLTAARENAAAEGLAMTFVEGSSFDLDETAGPFRLVAMGRSFHWMDRAATLALLDRIILPGGGVALFHDAHPPVEENAWFRRLHDVGEKYGRRGEADRRVGGHRRYEPYLFASAFTQIDGLSVTIRKQVTEDEIVGRAYSLSACSTGRLGEQAAAFEAELRAAMRALSPDGVFIEVAELVAVLARREI